MHTKVIADAVETNLTSVRTTLVELRDAGLVSWGLILPHRLLPTRNYTRTNVNPYIVEADALLRPLGGHEAAGSPRTVAGEQLAGAVEGARHDKWLRQGRAKSPFAVVFASLATIERFASSARKRARRIEATARERAAERRAARARFDDVPALSPAESAELAALALRTMAYPVPAGPL